MSRTAAIIGSVNSGDQAAAAPAAHAQAPVDAAAAIRSRGYLALLVLAAVLGVPLAVGAWAFLQAVAHIQTSVFDDLPGSLGFHGVPAWWPLIPLAVAGVVVALTVRYLPGTGGHLPADGFHTGGVFGAADLPGILIAAVASIGLGAVIGPEAPLIALGGGVAAIAMRLLKRDADVRAVRMAGAAGSFAAVSALLGSPLLGAFLLMEAAGLGGPMLGVVLMPGLLAAGIGALVFTGMDSWTGLSSQSLTIPGLPPPATPTFAEFGWSLLVGVAAALAGWLVHRGAKYLQQSFVLPRQLLLTPAAGLVVAGLAIAYNEATGKSTADVLFSGQDQIGPVVTQSAHYTAGALALLVLLKGLAYSVSLSAFRGGPIFPAIFIGAVGGMAMSHLPGLQLVPAVAMGIGALTDAMLTLPLTSVLLATLLLGKGGITAMPLVIVSVVVCHVLSARLPPWSKDEAGKRQAARGPEQHDGTQRGGTRPKGDGEAEA
jgi:H+/Cl- antiporter ClcA